VDRRIILAVHISTTRTSLDALYFSRKALETCDNSSSYWWIEGRGIIGHYKDRFII